MSQVSEILQYNRQFVEDKEYEKYLTGKFPDKKMVVITCMDTRLVELLPKAMNLKNGDVKIIKIAGGIVSHPFGSVMRSILVALYELKADEVIVVGHLDCGMAALDGDHMIQEIRNRGISEEVLSTLEHSGIDLNSWLRGFKDIKAGVTGTVDLIKNHLSCLPACPYTA